MRLAGRPRVDPRPLDLQPVGAAPLVEASKDKPTVIALREIAAGKVGKEQLAPPAPVPPVL